jgi:hypothetical protein
MGIDYPHAPLSHTLLTVILKALRINHESTYHVSEQSAARFSYRGIEIVREPINELAILFVKFLVRK